MSGVGAVHFVADAAVAEYVQRLGLSKLHMSQVQVPPEPPGLPAIPDEEIICSVCFNGDAEDNNAIVICSKCSIGVHQACYGVPEVPEDDWLCAPCSMGINPTSLVCAVCPCRGPQYHYAFKPASDGVWLHMACAMWLPEISFADIAHMTPSAVLPTIGDMNSKQDYSKRMFGIHLKCVCCGLTEGAMLMCCFSGCRVAYHPLCAQRSGFRMEQHGIVRGRDSPGVAMASYCPTHNGAAYDVNAYLRKWRSRFQRPMGLASASMAFRNRASKKAAASVSAGRKMPPSIMPAIAVAAAEVAQPYIASNTVIALAPMDVQLSVTAGPEAAAAVQTISVSTNENGVNVSAGQGTGPSPTPSDFSIDTPPSASVQSRPDGKVRKRQRATNAAAPRRPAVGVPGQVGLLNLGNSCFLNSVLQVLSNTRPFRDFMVRWFALEHPTAVAPGVLTLATRSQWGDDPEKMLKLQRRSKKSVKEDSSGVGPISPTAVLIGARADAMDSGDVNIVQAVAQPAASSPISPASGQPNDSLMETIDDNIDDDDVIILDGPPHRPGGAAQNASAGAGSALLGSVVAPGLPSVILPSTDSISLAHDLGVLLSEMWTHPSEVYRVGAGGRSRNLVLSPSHLLTALGTVYPAFSGFRQHDAQECFRLLLDRLDHELSSQKEHIGTLSTSAATVVAAATPAAVHPMDCKPVDDGENARVIEAILDKRLDPSSHSVQYLVAWRSAAGGAVVPPSWESLHTVGPAEHAVMAQFEETRMADGFAWSINDVSSVVSDGSSSASSSSEPRLSASVPLLNAGVVHDTFQGMLISEVTCCSCNYSFRKHDPFLDLSLNVPDENHSVFLRKTDDGAYYIRAVTLELCLRRFCSLERLRQSEQYVCSKCSQRGDTLKRIRIEKLPKVLCIHLKRFRWSTHIKEKVTTAVYFPVTGLDLSPYTLSPSDSKQAHSAAQTDSSTPPDPLLYDLIGVIVHHGSGLRSGHYTAYALNTLVRPAQWFHFDDNHVTAVSAEVVAQAQAYILFYEQRGA